MHEGNGTPCKHLRGDNPGEYSCALHDYPWYKETPCYNFTQIGKESDECRTGRYMIDKLSKS